MLQGGSKENIGCDKTVTFSDLRYCFTISDGRAGAIIMQYTNTLTSGH